MLANWQTSAIGIVALIAGCILLYLKVISWDQFMVFLGLFGLGMASKDHNVTGGSIPQASPPGVALKSDALGVIEAVEAIEKKGEVGPTVLAAKAEAEAVAAAPTGKVNG